MSTLLRRLLLIAAFFAGAPRLALAQQTHERPLPPAPTPSTPGGFLGYGGHAPQGPPNLHVLSVQIVDSAGNPRQAVAGKNFWVRVDYEYVNPVCTPYQIHRRVNDWYHLAPEINWGCGYTGVTNWWHYWGPWVVLEGGQYTTRVTLEATNRIAESREDDNAMTITFTVGGTIAWEWALVKATEGRQLLGPGTDVIVGTMDDAFEYRHPWFDRNDSRGRPRLVAASQNAAGRNGSPLNATHATAVMGIVLARPIGVGDLIGMAPDARYVTAEFINRSSINLPMQHVFDAAGFLVANGAEVINMSWSWYSSLSEAQTGEGASTNLMADYLAYGRNIVCVPAVNQLTGVSGLPTAPGAARNTICVGGLENDQRRAWGRQNHGPTRDGRSKPDLIGNDAASALAPSWEWEGGIPAYEGYEGTSFATPFVTGAVAQLLGYGKRTGQSTDHRVMKAVVMTSATRAQDSNGSAWNHSRTQPLDDQQGTGILDMVRAHAIYSGGRQSERVSPRGYDFSSVVGDTRTNVPGGRVIYRLGRLTSSGASLSATLVWDRHTFWNDGNNNQRIDAADDFYTLPGDAQDDLDLVLFRDGVAVWESRSTVDTIEHVAESGLAPGEYELHVERRFVANSGTSEDFALAWHADGTWLRADWPRPLIVGASPSWVPAGGADLTLTIDGTGFVSSSVVSWNGTNIGTTFISSTQITAFVSGNLMAGTSQASISVVNPPPGGGSSNVRTVVIGGPRTWIVDVQNRRGADFTDIQTALDAVPVGDAVLVRDGAYMLPLALRRGLMVSAESGVLFLGLPLVADRFSISNVPSGQRVVLRNLVLNRWTPSAGGITLSIEHCLGIVYLENVVSEFSTAVIDSPLVAMSGCSMTNVAVQASKLAADGCSFRGLDGVELGSVYYRSTPAVSATDSSVALSRCNVFGGNGTTGSRTPGSSAITLTNAGIGVTGMTGQVIRCGSGAPAGTAAVQGSGTVSNTLVIDPVVMIEGNGNLQVSGVTLRQQLIPSLHSGAMLIGSTSSLDLRGEASAPFVAFIGLPRPSIFIGELHGALGLDTGSLLLISAGALDGGGMAGFTVSVPHLSHLRDQVFVIQAVTGVVPSLSSWVTRAVTVR